MALAHVSDEDPTIATVARTVALEQMLSRRRLELPDPDPTTPAREDVEGDDDDDEADDDLV